MGRVEGKVAFVTGAARGQGRSHALRLAQEGADIIAVDICEQIETFPYPLSTPDDLAETVRQIEDLDRRIVARQADVRDVAALRAAVDDGVAELGRLDIVAANAGGYAGFGPAAKISEQGWRDTVDVCMTGVWNTYRAAIGHIQAGGRGGSMIFTSSGAGLRGVGYLADYVAAKTAVVGLMRSLAIEHGPESIRVNVVAPGNVNTELINNDAIFRGMRPDLENPGIDDVIDLYRAMNTMPVPWVEPIDISNAILFLASDEARYITGETLSVNAGSK